jgi:hypothetical protein
LYSSCEPINAPFNGLSLDSIGASRMA